MTTFHLIRTKTDFAGYHRSLSCIVLSSNESNKMKKKQWVSKPKRMRRERADIKRERMGANREMPETVVVEE
jgi:hypothetical protein